MNLGQSQRNRTGLIQHIRIVLMGACLALPLTLSACASGSAAQPSSNDQHGEMTFEQALTKAIHMIGEQGGQFVQVGETTLIGYPADFLFNGPSANLSEAGMARLQLIADILNRYDVIDVEVRGVTYRKHASVTKRGLAQSQANHVSAALWKLGVNVRMVYAANSFSQPTSPELFHASPLEDNLIQIRFKYLRD